MMVLIYTTLNIMSQTVDANINLLVQQDVSNFDISIPVSSLLTLAAQAGRSDWNTSDVQTYCQQVVGQPVNLPQ